MRKVLLAFALLLPPILAVGCLALAGEKPTPNSMVSLTWDSLLIVYGPMAVWLWWFVRRDGRIEARDIQREKDSKEDRASWNQVVQSNTEALIHLNANVNHLNVEVEKTRQVTHQVRDIVMKKSDGIWEPEAKGNTRFLPK